MFDVLDCAAFLGFLHEKSKNVDKILEMKRARNFTRFSGLASRMVINIKVLPLLYVLFTIVVSSIEFLQQTNLTLMNQIYPP